DRLFEQWLEGQESVLGPTVIPWLKIPILPDSRTRSQTSRFFSQIEALAVDERRLERIARLAASRGCGGWLVESDEVLTGDSQVTKRRLKTLSLINAQWKLIEPWIANGKVIGEINTSDPACTAAVWQVDRARLVIPLESKLPPRTGANGALPNLLTIIVPGVPESNQAFLLTPAGFSPLVQQRIAGGVRVQFDRESEGFVVFTEDPRVINGFRAQTQRMAWGSAQMRQEVVDLRLRALGTLGKSVRNPQLAQVGALLNQSKAQFGQRNPAGAYSLATAAFRQCERFIESQVQSVTPRAVLTSYPFPLSLDTLEHVGDLRAALHSRSGGSNLLYGGDFEDLHQLTQWGWKHYRVESTGVQSAADLSPALPHHGKYCLQLSNVATDASQSFTVKKKAPLRIVSPTIPVNPDGLIEISGWVRIDKPLNERTEGLKIEDSSGGSDLALRIYSTKGWRSFRLLRDKNGKPEFEFSISLHGLGQASLDALMVRAWDSDRGLAQPNTTVPPLPTAQAPGPLFPAPKLR
ncbi:MAG: hypothetical protein MJA83_17675, partial [Gammaproteobacteria bacterium]|nr:hypothetical protein [Gammaproteobacteria bacterium]